MHLHIWGMRVTFGSHYGITLTLRNHLAESRLPYGIPFTFLACLPCCLSCEGKYEGIDAVHPSYQTKYKT